MCGTLACHIIIPNVVSTADDRDQRGRACVRRAPSGFLRGREGPQHERTASVVFFDQVLRDIDRAFLAKFDAGLKMFRELTSSRAELEDGLGEIVADVTRKPPPLGTVLFDAVYKSADIVMSASKDATRSSYLPMARHLQSSIGTDGD